MKAIALMGVLTSGLLISNMAFALCNLQEPDSCGTKPGDRYPKVQVSLQCELNNPINGERLQFQTDRGGHQFHLTKKNTDGSGSSLSAKELVILSIPDIKGLVNYGAADVPVLFLPETHQRQKPILKGRNISVTEFQGSLGKSRQVYSMQGLFEEEFVTAYPIRPLPFEVQNPNALMFDALDFSGVAYEFGKYQSVIKIGGYSTTVRTAVVKFPVRCVVESTLLE